MSTALPWIDWSSLCLLSIDKAKHLGGRNSVSIVCESSPYFFSTEKHHQDASNCPLKEHTEPSTCEEEQWIDSESFAIST